MSVQSTSTQVLVEALPKLKYFFGRGEELLWAREFMDSETCKILILRGMAGVGKTATISKLVEIYQDKKNIVYLKVYPYSSLGGILSKLGGFLEKMGKEKLAKYLSTAKGNVELEGFLTAMQGDISGDRVLIILDDVHLAREEITKIFPPLMDMLDTTDAKLIISGRMVPRFYDKRDILVRKRLKEVVLGGLDEKSAFELLKYRGIETQYYQQLYSMTAGHPLMLELATPGATVDATEFIDKEVLEPLTDPEKKVLGLASVFRSPFPLDAVRSQADEATLKKLTEKLLLKGVDGGYEIHEMLRTIIYSRLTVEEKVGYHRLAGEFYLNVGTENALIEAVYHLIKGYKQPQAASVAIEKAAQLVQTGYGRPLMEEISQLQEAEAPDYWPYVLILKGDLMRSMEQLQEALKQYEMCVGYTESAGAKGGREVFSYLWFGVSKEFMRARALAYLRIGGVYVKMGNIAGAKEAYLQSHHLFKELGAAEVVEVEQALKEIEER